MLGPLGKSPSGATDSPRVNESRVEPEPVPNRADLDLESLLPAFSEVILRSGGVAPSDEAKPAIITNPYGAGTADFGQRSCDAIDFSSAKCAAFSAGLFATVLSGPWVDWAISSPVFTMCKVTVP